MNRRTTYKATPGQSIRFVAICVLLAWLGTIGLVTIIVGLAFVNFFTASIGVALVFTGWGGFALYTHLFD